MVEQVAEGVFVRSREGLGREEYVTVGKPAVAKTVVVEAEQPYTPWEDLVAACND